MTEIYASGLSNLRRTFDDTGYAFTCLNLSEKGLTTDQLENLSNYPHLQFLNLATNEIQELSPNLFVNLPYLLALNVSENKLNQFPFFSAFQSCQHLQVVNFAKNELTIFENPDNQSNGTITSLNASSNQFQTLNSLFLHQLTALKGCDVSFNQLSLIQSEEEEIESNETLETLNISNNQLTNLSGISKRFPSLVELFIQTNELNELDTIIDEIQALQQLTVLDLSNNPVTSQESYRLHFIAKCPHVKVLDQISITTDERLEAQEWRKKNETTEKE